MVDQVRIWLTRFLAPLVFLAAVTVLVIVVQRALDDNGGSSATTQVTEPTGSVPVTIETGGEEVSEGEREFYRIRPGDNLENIAGEFNTTVDRLLELNPDIDPLALEPGTRIRVA
jgi:hypothetical protein